MMHQPEAAMHSENHLDKRPSVVARRPIAERLLEQALFSSRWLMAPFYVGLAAGLLLLLVEFVHRTIALFSHGFAARGEELTVAILSLIDLSLMGNLLLMVIFAGYENFISRLDLDRHDDRPSWMGHVGFGDLKLKLMTSIVAISAIQVLEGFMHVSRLSDRELAWSVGLHLAFILSAVMLALMDRLSSHVPKQQVVPSVPQTPRGDAGSFYK
jgi:uncharacterized protein (TIGR00645 family)